MKANTIKSWMGKTVRIKREYLSLREDYEDYEEVNEPYYYIDTPNGMNGVLWSEDLLNATFYVQYDCYGVDLFNVREDKNISDLPEPVHQIIVRESKYPYLWKAEYFELVTNNQTNF